MRANNEIIKTRTKEEVQENFVNSKIMVSWLYDFIASVDDCL